MAARFVFLGAILIILALMNLIASIVLLAALKKRLPTWAKVLLIIVLVVSALFLVIFAAVAIFKAI